jgi:histidine triad (HIT) family protein
VHILCVPERHIDTFRQIGELPPEEALRMLVFIADTARALSLEDYRVLCTVGPSAGQTVFHLHWHLLGGRDLSGRLPALALAEAEGED